MTFDEMIPGRGPLHASICVVGEAPGRREMEMRLPFVGPSGKLQEAWILAAGLDPQDIRYENVYPTMPPGGNIVNVAAQELVAWSDDMLARLDVLPHIRVIVPTGNVALAALLLCTPQQAKITQRRGSIYLWAQEDNRKVKVIPVIHPAAVLREEGERGQEDGQAIKKNYEARCRADWRKIAQEVCTGLNDIPPQRDLYTRAAPQGFNVWVREYLRAGWPLAYDIETNPQVGKILCISFANGPDQAISVPWTKAFLPGITTLIESDLPKITQNGHYDNYWLAQEGIHVRNWQHDTMAKSCLLAPNEPHSLAYLASIYTREPWYKGSDLDTGEKVWHGAEENHEKWQALLAYNARDSAVTWEVNARQDEQLTAKGWYRVYEEQYRDLFLPILRTMLHGMAVDQQELGTAFTACLERTQHALIQAQSLAGRELFTYDTQVQEACWKVAQGVWSLDDPVVFKKMQRAKGDSGKYIEQVAAKGISTQILAQVLYDDMHMPAQRKRVTHAITTDEAALLKLRAKHKDSPKYTIGVALIEHVLTYREHKKQSEFLNPGRLDADGRFRASYSFRPTTGRLSSASNPRGSGGNAQNIDRDLRKPFRPDRGCVLVEVDLSQAEARVVYCLTRDKQLIELAHTRPETFDVHTYMASEVFGFGPWDASEVGQARKKADRYLAKRIVHATHYDLHGNKGSEICLKDKHDVSPKRFEALQACYREFAPGLAQWQQRTRMEGLSLRKLENAWGRVIEFPYDRPGDDWYRKLYAWRPQSDVARHLNQAWVRFDAALQCEAYQDVHVNLQLHDALIFSVPPARAYAATRGLVHMLEEPHEYYGTVLTIPAEIKVGLAWGQGLEYKSLPPRDDFQAGLARLLTT